MFRRTCVTLLSTLYSPTQTRVIDAKNIVGQRPKVVFKKTQIKRPHSAAPKMATFSQYTGRLNVRRNSRKLWGFAKDTGRWQYPVPFFSRLVSCAQSPQSPLAIVSLFFLIEGCFPPDDTLFFRTFQIYEHYYYGSGSTALPFSSFR